MIAITLTDRATRKVRTLLDSAAMPPTASLASLDRSDAHAPGFGLRIGVDPGGCAGYQYSLALAPQPEADDVVLPRDGFDVYVHAAMAPLLNGVRIDYVESLARSGFTFDNPNAADACGCGTSFAATGAAQRGAADAARIARVEQALADIRPYLRSEGGDVTVVGIDDGGVVTVRLTGACGSCSLSQATLTGVIERRLVEALPEVTRVVAVS